MDQKTAAFNLHVLKKIQGVKMIYDGQLKTIQEVCDEVEQSIAEESMRSQQEVVESECEECGIRKRIHRDGYCLRCWQLCHD